MPLLDRIAAQLLTAEKVACSNCFRFRILVTLPFSRGMTTAFRFTLLELNIPDLLPNFGVKSDSLAVVRSVVKSLGRLSWVN